MQSISVKNLFLLVGKLHAEIEQEKHELRIAAVTVQQDNERHIAVPQACCEQIHRHSNHDNGIVESLNSAIGAAGATMLSALHFVLGTSVQALESEDILQSSMDQLGNTTQSEASEVEMPEQMTDDAKPCETESMNLDDFGPGKFFSQQFLFSEQSRHYV